MKKFIALIFLVFFANDSIFACSCVPITAENLAQQDMVFIGEVKRKKWSFWFQDRKFRFTIKEQLKGEFKKEIDISSKRYSSCRVIYQKNIEYLVIVTKSKNKNYSNYCGSFGTSHKSVKDLLQQFKKIPNKSLNTDATTVAPIS